MQTGIAVDTFHVNKHYRGSADKTQQDETQHLKKLGHNDMSNFKVCDGCSENSTKAARS